MNKQRHLALVSCILFAGSVLAQETAEELLKKGAVKLTAAEIRQQLVGVATEGALTSDPLNVVTRTLNADGSYTARTTGVGAGKGASLHGTWSIRDDAAICTEGRTFRGKPVGSCSYWYKLGDRYFVVRADDPAGAAAARTIKR